MAVALETCELRDKRAAYSRALTAASSAGVQRCSGLPAPALPGPAGRWRQKQLFVYVATWVGHREGTLGCSSECRHSSSTKARYSAVLLFVRELSFACSRAPLLVRAEFYSSGLVRTRARNEQPATAKSFQFRVFVTSLFVNCKTNRLIWMQTCTRWYDSLIEQPKKIF